MRVRRCLGLDREMIRDDVGVKRIGCRVILISNLVRCIVGRAEHVLDRFLGFGRLALIALPGTRRRGRVEGEMLHTRHGRRGISWMSRVLLDVLDPLLSLSLQGRLACHGRR